jgi:hypothetical protein
VIQALEKKFSFAPKSMTQTHEQKSLVLDSLESQSFVAQALEQKSFALQVGDPFALKWMSFSFT